MWGYPLRNYGGIVRPHRPDQYRINTDILHICTPLIDRYSSDRLSRILARRDPAVPQLKVVPPQRSQHLIRLLEYTLLHSSTSLFVAGIISSIEEPPSFQNLDVIRVETPKRLMKRSGDALVVLPTEYSPHPTSRTCSTSSGFRRPCVGLPRPADYNVQPYELNVRPANSARDPSCMR